MLRFGLVGYGSWGPNVARNIDAMTGSRLEVVCDSSPLRSGAAGARYPRSTIVSDSRAVFDHPGVDAVAIATPANTHYRLARQALDAGKHVFLEKPLASTSAEALDLIHQSERRGLTLMVDHTFVFAPAVRAMRRLLAMGAVGEPRFLQSERLNAGVIRKDAPVHWDLASHDLSILDYLFPNGHWEVSAAAGEHYAISPLAATLRLARADGVQAQVTVSWVAAAKTRHMEIAGAEGTMFFDDLQAAGKVRVLERSSGKCWAPEIERSEPLALALAHFVECIATGRAPLSDGLAGLRVIRLLEAADALLGEGKGPIAVGMADAGNGQAA